jgi:hypothetical protein
MKRVFFAVVFSCAVISVVAIAAAQSLKRDLVGLGVPAEVANELGNSIPPAYATAGYSQDVRFQAGAAPRLAPFVPTLAATPVAGTNDFRIGINAVPTAAANTAAILPTPAGAGQQVIVANTMANAVRIKAGGTNTINGSAAGAYIPLAAQAVADCHATSATNWYCGYRAVPTPAGP